MCYLDLNIRISFLEKYHPELDSTSYTDEIPYEENYGMTGINSLAFELRIMTLVKMNSSLVILNLTRPLIQMGFRMKRTTE